MNFPHDDSVDPTELGTTADEVTLDAAGDDSAVGTLTSLSEEQLPGALRRALTTKGYLTLTAVQTAVVQAQTSAKDLRISSQTGSGKTVAVGLALGRMLLELGPRAGRISPERGTTLPPEILLLTPTRELATQVRQELSWLLAHVQDAQVEVVTGGTSVGLERKHLARGPRIIVATPGRALDHLQNGGFSGKDISCVVLDEADQMLDMGFRDELAAILEEVPGRKRTHLVSATFSGEVLRIAQTYQNQVERIEGTALGAANSDIEHIAHVVSLRHRYDALVNLLLKQRATAEDEDGGRVLIFTRTRVDTIEVAERLQRDGLKAEPLSGDLAQAQRTRTLGAFRSGRIQVLVATDVAARGIDVQGIDLVVHFDPPGDPDAFTHRSGRTGRAGRKGTSVMLLPPQARARMERLYRAARVKPEWLPVPGADKIKKLYTKLSRRKLYSVLETAPDSEQLAYAQRLLTEHAPDRVVAQLLSMIDVAPPCPPREITEHFAVEGRSAERKREQFDKHPGRDRFREPRFRPGGHEPRGRGDGEGGEPRFRPGGHESKVRGNGQGAEPRFRGPRSNADTSRGRAPGGGPPRGPAKKAAKRFR
ncbi:MAG TPA: DEAD/DEAH box helicase [Polyangiaceae bacterium]|nr:DEAD/DEAH box helicase [Polyangiaceae bacterium]